MGKPQETDGSAAVNALDALRSDWGSAYEIEGHDDCWRARRLDECGGWIETTDPVALRSQIISDYTLRPMGPQSPQAAHDA